MAIRKARGSDAATLSQLAIRSKAVWEYSAEQMRVFVGELTMTAEDIGARVVYVLERGAAPLAFYTLKAAGDQEAELEHLFVDPQAMGQGCGRQLFEHACRTARALGYVRLTVLSDPHADGFYEALGCVKRRDINSSIPGRVIPLYVFDLLEGECARN